MAWDWFSELPAEIGWDLMVRLQDRPGTLADLGDALREAGVDVSGGCAVTLGNEGLVHLLLMDGVDDARQALARFDIEIEEESQVLVLDVEDQPGGIIGWAIARKLAEAKINIGLFYVATRTRLVYGVDDLEKARETIDG